MAVSFLESYASRTQSIRLQTHGAAMPKIGRSKTMGDRIRATIQAVPRGKVSSYGAIARAAGYPRAARQVVQTLHRSFGLPWHRIVGAGGEIKLRGDSAIEQRLRLQAEGVVFRGRRVDMRRYEHKFEKKLRTDPRLSSRAKSAAELSTARRPKPKL